MIACRQLAFGFGQVERTAVGFRIAGNQVDDESYQSRDMSFEDEPAVGLSGYDFGELHRTHQDYHRQDAQSAREFVTDDLRTASHGSDKRELIVGTPAGKQDTYHADARSGKQEEHAHVEVQHFQAFADRQAGEGEERGYDDHERCQVVEESVGELQVDDFLGQHLDNVARHLEQSPFSYTHRTEAALEKGAYLALHVNQDNGKHCIHQDDAYAYHYTFKKHRQTFRHEGGQHLVNPIGYYTKVKHLFIYGFTIYDLRFDVCLLSVIDVLFAFYRYRSISGTT